MTKDSPTAERAAYYRTKERTEAVVFHFRFYGGNARWLFTKAVPASQLNDELDALRKQGIPAQRVT